MKTNNHQPLVTFVVVGWNNKDLIDGCFASILDQTYPNFNIIYVDNGSSDGSPMYVKKQHPAINTVDVGSNQGFAIGNNIGISKAFENQDCQYVALLNSDATIRKDWLTTLITFAAKHPKGAAFQTPTYDYYDHAIVDSTSIAINHRGQAVQLGHRTAKGSLQTKQVFGVNAAAALYSRRFLDTQPFGQDYFDQDMWMYLEDVDIAARAIVTGWENWTVIGSEAYHMGSASSSKNPGFSVYMIYRNNLPMLIKNLSLFNVAHILPRLLLADTRIVYGLLRGHNYRTAKALLRGRLHGIPMSFRFLSKHRLLKKSWKLTETEIWELLED